MFFPKLKAQSRQRRVVEQFAGLDRRPGSGAGCLREMKNLWSGGYPALEVRPRRSVMAELTKPHAFLGREALVWVDSTGLYINGAKTAPVLSDGDKRLVCMGAYLLVWPDKVYINTQDLSDWGRLENTRQTSGEVTFALCDESGTALGDYTVRTYAPGEPETGDLWLDTSRPACVMRRYDGSAWLELEGVCTRITAAHIGTGFSAGDGVTLSGCGSSELNGLHVLQAVGDNWIVVPALCRTLGSQTAVVTVMRTVPDMDFVVEQGNRLWGCKYGIVGGETWGSLLSAPTAAEQQAAAAAAEEAARPEARVTESTARRLAELEKGYQPSEDVAAARAYRDSVAAMQPGEYDSGFEDQLQALYDQIEGREAFSYDPEEDEAYRRYAKLYSAQGAAAMEDTMGQAASLTGGYGSSYAQAVGQQAYDRYLGELAALVPELRQAALAEYRQEGQALTDRYNMLNQQKKAGYDRWQDTVAQWQKALSEAQSSYEDVSAQDEKAYQAMLKHYADKAEQERKLSAAGAKLEDSGYEADAGKESLSSTAADSLQRAVGNYLKSGREDTARALLQQYAQRMTPAQRKRFEALFSGYGRKAGW